MIRILSFSVLLLLTACGEPPPSGDAEACEHLADGPSVAVTAAASGEGGAISDDHRRYDITLPATTGGFGGRVHFAAEEAGDFVFFFNRTVSAAYRAATDGAATAVEDRQTSGLSCAEIGQRDVVPLAVGTWVLDIGPTDSAELSVVVENAAEGAH